MQPWTNQVPAWQDLDQSEAWKWLDRQTDTIFNYMVPTFVQKYNHIRTFDHKMIIVFTRKLNVKDVKNINVEDSPLMRRENISKS